MKTTKRSKMLLSSIAMLLVALVALGSATYAWYKVNQEVTASTFTVKASVPAGLLICDTNSSTAGEWGTGITLSNNTSTPLKPASLTFDTTGMATVVDAVADDVTAYTKNSAAATDRSTGTDYYILDEFWVKATGSSQNVKVAVKSASTLGNTFMNLAIVDVTAGKVVDVVKSAGTSNGALTTSGAADFAAAAASLDDAAITDTQLVTNAYADLAGAATITIPAEDSNGTNAHHFMAYAYADGQNTNCKTVGADTSAIAFDIKVYY